MKPPESVVTLDTLLAGQSARFHDADLRCEDCDLLNALGLTPTCDLEVCKAGNPFILRVRTTRIGISTEIARQIRVIPHTAIQ